MKKIILIAIISLVLITGIAFFVNRESNVTDANINSKENSDQVVAQNSENSQVNQATEKEAIKGAYVEYSEQSLTSSSNTKRVVFFHAPWCSTCNYFEGQIEEQGVPDNVTILKVDYDSETELKKKYGVNIQSTFVQLAANGAVVKTWPFARGLSGIQDLYNQI
jgi:thioredoxin 1